MCVIPFQHMMSCTKWQGKSRGYKNIHDAFYASRELLWYVTESAASKSCCVVLEKGFLKDLGKKWKNGRIWRKSAWEGARDLGTSDLRGQWDLLWPACKLPWHWVKRQNSSWEVLWRPPSKQAGVWEKSQQVFLSGGPMERENRKERGSKGEVTRKRKKDRKEESQLKFIITISLCYLIMNEDFIV